MGQIERQLGQAIALKELSLNISGTQKVLVQRLSVEVSQGPSGCEKSSLLRAIAGLWSEGVGTISAPTPDRLWA